MNYEEIFRERGGAYHHAMQRWPEARREEFQLPIARAKLAPGSQVADVPAGGGYLARYLPAGSTWLGHEPCASFREHSTGPDTDLLPLPWSAQYADAAISIAGVHHLPDKRPLFHDLHRILKPHGRLVLADAHANSAVARFLDEFVGRYNSTGHDGEYLDESALFELESCGFEISSAERLAYSWWFASRQEMGMFCKLLFDIRRATDTQVADAIADYLGIIECDGEVGMNWELFLILAERRAR